MVIHSLQCEQLVPAPIPEVWQFFSDPRNLEKITPPDMQFRILTPDLPQQIYPGLFIEYRVSPLWGIPLTWVTEITHVVERVFFCDEQRIGPYRIWSHKHFFERAGRHTLMRDRVDYALPALPLQGVVHSLIVRKRLEQIFSFRRQAVEKIFAPK
ncbi:MAG: SRPBCC family protein [Turneriella sp.]|nr:SRPBCC family protein [Leptospiraceae bacterium]MCX7632403.1 SRPBCC family protein [Turneriella sp.]